MLSRLHFKSPSLSLSQQSAGEALPPMLCKYLATAVSNCCLELEPPPPPPTPPPPVLRISPIFIGPRCPWGPIYGSGCLSLTDWTRPPKPQFLPPHKRQWLPHSVLCSTSLPMCALPSRALLWCLHCCCGVRRPDRCWTWIAGLHLNFSPVLRSPTGVGSCCDSCQSPVLATLSPCVTQPTLALSRGQC